jgi:uncharacterized repeat protein (TIGR01451 family)
MTNIAKTFAIAVALAGAGAPAGLAAQDEQPVMLAGDVMAVEVTTDASGREVTRLVEPGTIVPGDRLIFGTDYANTGNNAVGDFVVTNPLPEAVRLAPDADPALTVSVDGAASWGTLSTLTVTEADGSTRTARHEDVTHVRWILARIAPGEKGRVEYPAIIR